MVAWCVEDVAMWGAGEVVLGQRMMMCVCV